jgi:hypothetical protein
MHKSATKCNETIDKWCKNKHGASKIIDTFETYHPSWQFDASGTVASPAVSSRQPRPCHVPAASASSHDPLTACVDACRWRAQQLLGAPDPSLPREGAFAGQAPEGYCRCSRYRGIPVHLLLGHFNSPASAWEQNEDRSPARKALMRRRLMRRTTTKLLRTRRPPREVFLMRGGIRSVSAQHIPVLSEKIRLEDGISSMLS